MTDKKTEALKLALEALEESLGYVEEEAENAQRLYGQYQTRQARIQGLKDDARKHMEAITAIREALAEQPAQQQEPVAWMSNESKWRLKQGGNSKGAVPVHKNKTTTSKIPLYTTPPASKPWVGLTEQERNDLEDYCEMIIGKAAFEAIEAKLKEKNT